MTDTNRRWTADRLQLLALDVLSERARVEFHIESIIDTVEAKGTPTPNKYRIRIQVEYDA
jgi:hypothetical protein